MCLVQPGRIQLPQGLSPFGSGFSHTSAVQQAQPMGLNPLQIPFQATAPFPYKPGPDGWRLHDLGSTNGVSVDGVMLEVAHLLADGERIELGSTVRSQKAGWETSAERLETSSIADTHSCRRLLPAVTYP